MTPTATAADLRRDRLAALRSIDFRSPERDFWADEAAIWDRLVATWAGAYVEALDGLLRVESPRGSGTRIRAEIPCG